MINLLIADDHTILMDGLRLMLEKNKDINVVDMVKTGQEAIDACKNKDVDIVLMDINMPIIDGISCTKTIKSLKPQIKVIILTSYEDIESLTNSISAGVDGYLLKTLDQEELINAIYTAHNGICVLQREVVDLFKKLLNGDISNQNLKIRDNDIELIKLLSEGYSNREIAEKLNYSEGTIKNKITKIMNEVDVKDRTQLVVYAIKNNYI